MDDDNITLPSGRSVYANCGYVGISGDLSLSTGYDDRIWINRTPAASHYDELSVSEIIELCDVAIGRWAALKQEMVAENGGADGREA